MAHPNTGNDTPRTSPPRSAPVPEFTPRQGTYPSNVCRACIDTGENSEHSESSWHRSTRRVEGLKSGGISWISDHRPQERNDGIGVGFNNCRVYVTNGYMVIVVVVEIQQSRCAISQEVGDSASRLRCSLAFGWRCSCGLLRHPSEETRNLRSPILPFEGRYIFQKLLTSSGSNAITNLIRVGSVWKSWLT